jgi:transglutaminase-like putative cysteine protease
MKRLTLIINTILLGFYLFYPVNAIAIVKFNTDFQNYYRVDTSGNTHVTFVIRQKNNLSAIYATEFGININETKVSNIRVTDEGTIITPDIVKTINQTIISFPFAHKIVGKDSVHSFMIEYDSGDIATKFGNTWQVNIPRLETNENISSQSVVLSVPTDFSTLAYIDPKPQTNVNNTYYFNGSQIANKPISAVFGQTQYYKGSLTYHLINDVNADKDMEIALPPDTAYQSVYFENISPQPTIIKKDEDGNYLARYHLDQNSSLDIKVTMYFKLNFAPKPTDQLPTDNYLISNRIWNYDNGVFTTPEINNLRSANAIYDFVVDKLKYDFEKVNRQKSQKVPAAESLINYQSAICTDFTNIFVSLARKTGIPSRELEGFAMSENPNLKPLSLTQDVLHAWPEYFNKSTNTWVQIDPTWSNTTRGIDYFNKLDFNHLVFVIHGINPDYPVPAGGYKYKQEKSKDVNVEPISVIQFPDPKFSLISTSQKGSEISLKIKNDSGVLFSGNTITEHNEYIAEVEQTIEVIPYGITEIKIKLQNQPFIFQTKSKVIIYLNGNRYEQSLAIYPKISQAYIFTLIGIILGSVTLITRNLYIRKRHKNTAIYR